MNILSISLLAVIAVIIMVMLKPKNGEIAIMLGICASVIILLSVLSQVTQIMDTVNNIIAVSGISTSYIVILLKVITCKDAGSQSLAGNVSLAGKILVTITALPLYSDILSTVTGLLNS